MRNIEVQPKKGEDMLNFENNLEFLNKVKFSELISKVSMEESSGKIVSYLTLIVDGESGKILEILPNEVRYYENGLVAPLAVEQKNILAGSSDFRLRLVQLKDEEWPDNIRECIENCLKEFNKKQEKIS